MNGKVAIFTVFLGITLLLVMSNPTQAFARSTPVFIDNVLNCDTLPRVEFIADELGIAPVFLEFFPDELITSSDAPTDLVACPSTDSDDPNVLVTITNIVSPPRSFSDLWYVQNRDTLHSNFDAIIKGSFGFKIDAVGINTPLIFESVAVDGIFSPGETWEFIIDDYAGDGPASAFSSANIPSGGPSTGSILALEMEEGPMVGGELIPLDATMVLVAGTHSLAARMIPVIVSAIGIAIVIARKL